MTRKKFIAGNWKMNQTLANAKLLASALKKFEINSHLVDVAVCPPFTALWHVASELRGSKLAWGAQDVSATAPGAFTGDIAAEFLKDIDCQYCIVGHSERRQLHAENDFLINRKTHRLLELGIKPILCVGETLEQRELEITFDVVHTQLRAGFIKITPEQALQITIAYEPVWAIGTGKVATAEQAEAVHAFIRETLSKRFGSDIAQGMRILYGGSVKASNAKELLSQPNIDGALVGGASLVAEDFIGIIAGAQAVSQPQAVS